MAAKVAVLDRVLSLFGPETKEARVKFRASMEDAIRRLWPQEKNVRADLAPNLQVGDSVYFAINALSPANDAQQKLKALAETYAADLAQLRALLVAQSQSSISVPMLIVVVCWLVVIFAGFSLLAPPNTTANLALYFRVWQSPVRSSSFSNWTRHLTV